MTLIFNVLAQTLWMESQENLAADSVEYVSAAFSFSDDWQGTTKSAIFTAESGSSYTVLLIDDACTVPAEALCAGLLSVSAFGVAGAKRITTNPCSIRVGESGYTEGKTPAEPTPDVYAQILAALDEATEAESTGLTNSEIEELLNGFAG